MAGAYHELKKLHYLKLIKEMCSEWKRQPYMVFREWNCLFQLHALAGAA